MSLKILFFAALSIPVPWEQNDIIIESPQNLELGIYLLFRVLQSNVGCKQLLAVPFLFHASGISQPRCNTWEGEPEKDFLSRQTSFQKKCTVEP